MRIENITLREFTIGSVLQDYADYWREVANDKTWDKGTRYQHTMGSKKWGVNMARLEAEYG